MILKLTIEQDVTFWRMVFSKEYSKCDWIFYEKKFWRRSSYLTYHFLWRWERIRYPSQNDSEHHSVTLVTLNFNNSIITPFTADIGIFLCRETPPPYILINFSIKTKKLKSAITFWYARAHLPSPEFPSPHYPLQKWQFPWQCSFIWVLHHPSTTLWLVVSQILGRTDHKPIEITHFH